MECPHCQQDCQIDELAIMNMQNYGSNLLLKTLCCGKAIVASPNFGYMVFAYDGEKTEDDWGNEFDQ